MILAFLLETIGAMMMAAAPNLQILILSVFVMCVGGAFYSGTIDALAFDSLKEDGKEKTYDKKISNINAISLITPALCGVQLDLGGQSQDGLQAYASAYFSLGRNQLMTELVTDVELQAVLNQVSRIN